MKRGFTAYAFKTRQGFPNTISTTAVVDWTGVIGDVGFAGEHLIEIRGQTYCALAASENPGVPDKFDQNHPTRVYILGSENYDGLKRIYNVRGNRSVQIYSPYVAETLTGASFRCAYKAEVPCEFGGFSWHYTDDEAAVGVLSVTIYSAKGAAFDNTIYSKDMQKRTVGMSDVEHWFKPPRYLAPGDRVDFSWPHSGGYLGIILYVRKL